MNRRAFMKGMLGALAVAAGGAAAHDRLLSITTYHSAVPLRVTETALTQALRCGQLGIIDRFTVFTSRQIASDAQGFFKYYEGFDHERFAHES